MSRFIRLPEVGQLGEGGGWGGGWKTSCLTEGIVAESDRAARPCEAQTLPIEPVGEFSLPSNTPRRVNLTYPGKFTAPHLHGI